MALIDHVVHVVADLDAAAASYEALGFTVTPRAEHPWGTANRLVLVQGSYVELLAVPDHLELPAPGPGEFGFAHRARRYLAGGQGAAMLVLATEDAAAAQARFDAAGFGGFAALDFARRATQPDGTEADVAFSLAFAAAPQSATSFFACRHHTPDRVWHREYLAHANGASALTEVSLMGDPTGPMGGFLADFTGLPALTGATVLGGPDALAFVGDGQRITLGPAAGVAATWGMPPPATGHAPPVLAGLRFAAPGPGRSHTVAAVHGVLIEVA